MTLSFKQKVYSRCLQLLDDKIQNLQMLLHDLKEGAENESKSSAGDKHETARAMIQLEHEKISRQLDEMHRQKNDLHKIDLTTASQKIINGSLIQANSAWLFLSVAIGKINVEGVPVIIFSPQSPLGMKMLGKKSGDAIEMNGIKYIIESVI